MKKVLAAAGILALLATPAFAQQNQDEEAPAASEAAQEDAADAPDAPPSAEEVEAAVTAINALVKDTGKVETYCEILDDEDALKEGDTAGAEAIAKRLDAFIGGLGDDAQLAFDIDETIDRTSAQGQKLGGAFLKLEDACAADEPSEG